jgi:hypothetical protein
VCFSMARRLCERDEGFIERNADFSSIATFQNLCFYKDNELS